MSSPKAFELPSARELEHVRALADRTMTAEEFAAYVNAPMSDAERSEIQGQIEWFTRRYPTPAERLRSARRAYKQWVFTIR
jgi:hypothetical protein